MSPEEFAHRRMQEIAKWVAEQRAKKATVVDRDVKPAKVIPFRKPSPKGAK